VPEALRGLMALNPFALLFESYRDCIQYGRTPDVVGLAMLAVGSGLLLALSLAHFDRRENTLMRLI
jgi:ABC-type polysaccharide/polyol phosphate export permease